MISSLLVSENTLDSFTICCFALGATLFLSNSNIVLTGKFNCFNSRICSNPCSFSISKIVNFSTLSCDISRGESDSSFCF